MVLGRVIALIFMEGFVMDLLHDILYVVVVTVVSIVAKYVVAYFEAKRKEIESRNEQETFSNTLISAISLIESAVDTVSQTYVDSLKKSGNFTKEAQDEAFERALTASKNLMDSQTKQILTAAYSDLDKWIEIQIESYIKNQKVSQSAS